MQDLLQAADNYGGLIGATADDLRGAIDGDYPPMW